MGVKALQPLKTAERWQINPESGSPRSAFIQASFMHMAVPLLKWTERWIGNLFLSRDKWWFSVRERVFVCVQCCVWVAEGNTKRDRKRKPGFMFVCLHHMHCVFDFVCVPVCPSISVCVCVCVCVHVCVCGFTLVHELHICPDSFGSTD